MPHEKKSRPERRDSETEQETAAARQPEQHLPASEERLQSGLDYAQSIIDTVREPLLVLDDALRIRTANRSFCRVFEVDRIDTEGRLVYELGNGQWNIPKLRLLLQEILAENTAFDDFEVDHHFPHLGRRVMLLNARKVWREGNHSASILLAIEDVTERYNAEAERRKTAEALERANQTLESSARELARSNEDLEQFARVAAHDLRAPLRTIVQFSQMLVRRHKDAQDDRTQEYVRFIEQGGQRMTALIDDLMRYALVAQMPLIPQVVQAASACDMAVKNLTTAIEGNAAKVSCLIPEQVTVKLEINLLAQVFQNLIANAILYRRPKIAPRIEVNAQAEGFHWLFSVQDNGIGIEKQNAEKIFEPFRRLHGSDRPGSGIGLATCKRVIERAGGVIWVDSRIGQGSTFFFRLPKASA